jgi:hypothetical protein
MRLARSGLEIPLEQRARYRWDAGKAIDWSIRRVDRLSEASGGRGIFLDNPIQRAGAMSTRCALTRATPRNTPLWCSHATNSACRRRKSDFTPQPGGGDSARASHAGTCCQENT